MPSLAFCFRLLASLGSPASLETGSKKKGGWVGNPQQKRREKRSPGWWWEKQFFVATEMVVEEEKELQTADWRRMQYKERMRGLYWCNANSW